MARSHVRVAVTGLLTLFVAGILAAFGASPAAAANSVGNPFPAPTNLRVSQFDDGGLRVSWNASGATITAYTLRLDDTVVAKTTIVDGVVPTHLDLWVGKVSAGGLLSVTATYTGLAESERSKPLKLLPTPGQAEASASPSSSSGSTEAPADESGGSSIFGGAVQAPSADTTVKNNPTAFEKYGLSDGYTQVSTALDKTNPADLASAPWNQLAEAIWQFGVFIQISGFLVFAWSVARQTYSGLTVVTTAMVELLATNRLTVWLSLAVLLGYVVWSAFKIGRNSSLIYKSGAYLSLFMAAGMMYLFTAGTTIPQLTQAPLTATQFVIAATDKLGVAGTTEADYHLSVHPTYDGPNQLQQTMRRHVDAEWLQNGYPAYCQINFGSAKWATTHYVPSDSDLPTYKHLTFCEYLLKASTEHNETAMNKLGGSLGTGIGTFRIGGDKGYIEKASPDVWDFARGRQASERIVYAGINLFSQLLLAALNWGLGLLIVLIVAMLCLDAVLLVFWLIVGQYPDLREKAFKHMKSMSIKIITPALVAGVILLSLALLNALVQLLGPSGWLVTSVVQAMCTLAVIVYGAMRAWRWMFGGDKEKAAEAVSSSLGSPSQDFLQSSQKDIGGPTVVAAPTSIETFQDQDSASSAGVRTAFAAAAPTAIETGSTPARSAASNGGMAAKAAPLVAIAAPELAPFMAAATAIDQGPN